MLDHTIVHFDGIAAFQPVINGTQSRVMLGIAVAKEIFVAFSIYAAYQNEQLVEDTNEPYQHSFTAIGRERCTPMADPEILGRGEPVYYPSRHFIANAHNKLYAFCTERGVGFLRKKI